MRVAIFKKLIRKSLTEKEKEQTYLEKAPEGLEEGIASTIIIDVIHLLNIIGEYTVLKHR